MTQDMIIPASYIIGAAIALASAICFLYKQSLDAHKLCQDHGKVQDAAIAALHTRLETILAELVADSIASNKDMKRELKALTKKVGESSGEITFNDDSTDRIIR